jgi:hypothetical protein
LILAVAVFEKMPAKISSELKGVISALHGEDLSRRKIVKLCLTKGKWFLYRISIVLSFARKKGQRFAEAVEKAGDLMLTIKAH